MSGRSVSSRKRERELSTSGRERMGTRRGNKWERGSGDKRPLVPIAPAVPVSSDARSGVDQASDATTAREKLLFTPELAAELLSLSRATVYELIAAGELGSIKIGRSRRISPQALRVYIERLEAQQCS